MISYTEDTLVQQTTAEYLEKELGWRSIYAYNTEAFGPDSAVVYEVPYGAVREAMVNEVGHHDYASKSEVQVMLFADRLEVWNPGGLHEDLTVDQLCRPHPSVPRNRLLCEPGTMGT